MRVWMARNQSDLFQRQQNSSYRRLRESQLFRQIHPPKFAVGISRQLAENRVIHETEAVQGAEPAVEAAGEFGVGAGDEEAKFEGKAAVESCFLIIDR